MIFSFGDIPLENNLNFSIDSLILSNENMYFDSSIALQKIAKTLHYHSDLYLYSHQFFHILNYFISNNIALFGGIVRDIILQEHCKDIDCIMSEKQYKNLFFFLYKNKINFKFNGYNRDEYIPFEDSNNYIVEFSTIQISNTFSIDIFVHKNNANIYDVMDTIVGKNIDFYCNSLRYVNNKISINNQLIEKFLVDKRLLHDIEMNRSFSGDSSLFSGVSTKENTNLTINLDIILSIYFHENISFNEISNNIIVLHNIINQIKYKIAVSINNPDKHRIEKMIYKKWFII